MSDSAKYLNKREAAAYLSLGVSTLDRLRSSGGGPLYSRPLRRIIYRVSDLDAWVASHARQSTSDRRPAVS